MSLPRIVWADGVVLGDGDDLRDGAVVLSDDGTVLDVGPAAEVMPRFSGATVVRVAGVVCPGLVNAHCHVELSALRGQVPGGAGFVPWVERLLGARSELTPEVEAEGVEAGVAQLIAAGTVAVGEVSNTLGAVSALHRAGLVGHVFHEVLGVIAAPALDRLAGLVAEVDERLGGWPAGGLLRSATPHTVYTTHPDVVRAIAAHVRTLGGRMSLHLAEHPAERRALERGDGPVVDWYRERLKLPPGAFVSPGLSPVHYADSLGMVAPDVLLVHLTDARLDELRLVADRGAPVVVCPRSNLHIEGCLPPLLAMREAGLSPALGTDSLASSPSLDVLAEARALADRFPQITARELLSMATWNGACALGCPDLGRFARGARPGVFAVDGELGALSPSAFLLSRVKSPRRWVQRRMS